MLLLLIINHTDGSLNVSLPNDDDGTAVPVTDLLGGGGGVVVVLVVIDAFKFHVLHVSTCI